MQDALQKNNAENLKKIAEDYSEQIRTISQSVVDDTVKAIRRNSNTLNEETKKFNKELKAIKKTHFSFLVNALMYIFLGIILTFVGTVGFNFFKIQDGFYKELAENKKLESIEKKAVAEYKKTLTEEPKGIIELKKLELQWASNEKNVKWKDREKTLNSFKKDIEWAKELQK
jgi:hypothetical protein